MYNFFIIIIIVTLEVSLIRFMIFAITHMNTKQKILKNNILYETINYDKYGNENLMEIKKK